MKTQLSESLKRLRLSGLAESLEVRLQEARANRLRRCFEIARIARKDYVSLFDL